MCNIEPAISIVFRLSVPRSNAFVVVAIGPNTMTDFATYVEMYPPTSSYVSYDDRGFVGTIPSSLGSLDFITFLFVPRECECLRGFVRNCRLVCHRSLNYNRLTGTLPPSLGSLSRNRYMFVVLTQAPQPHCNPVTVSCHDVCCSADFLTARLLAHCHRP